MHVRHRHGDPLKIEEIAFPDQRKAVFREIARDLVSDRASDRSGTIARLMEKAFRAGAELTKSNPNFNPNMAMDGNPGMGGLLTREMIPPRARDALERIFFWTFGSCGHGSSYEKPCFEKPVRVLLYRAHGFLQKQNPWILTQGTGHDRTREYGATTISPLQRLELLMPIARDASERETLCLTTRAVAIFQRGRASLDEPAQPIFRQKKNAATLALPT